MDLTHIGEDGYARMVTVENKEITRRTAVVSGRITMHAETLLRIKNGGIKKGDVLAVAEIAGIMASKKTSDIVPLCHNVPLDCCEIKFAFLSDTTIEARATVISTAKTGVEMEAFVAVSAALITIYDMAKAIDRGMTMSDICLVHKSGGKSGEFNKEVRC